MSDFKLSYGSVILDRLEMSILEDELWFNDKLLSFMGEFMMDTLNKELSMSGKENVIHVFTPPETEMIRHAGSAEEVDLFFGMLYVDKVRFVAFIVNDNADVTRANGGSHWSLLVFDRKSDVFRHFDSMGGNNQRVALQLMVKVQKLVGQKKPQQELALEKVLQQGNGRDCGLFVAEYLWVLTHTLDIDAINGIQKVQHDRSFWKNLILNFSSDSDNVL